MGSMGGSLARRGRTSVLLVAAALVAVAAIGALLVVLGEPAAPTPPQEAPRDAPSSVEPPPREGAPLAPPAPAEPLSGDAAPGASAASLEPASTETLARLRVHATRADGSDFAGELTLHVEPIPELGRSDARRAIELRASGPRIDVHDARAGRWRAWATSSGRRSATVDVEVPAPPAAPLEPAAPVEIVLALESAGVLRGRLVDGKGKGLDGLAVTWIASTGLDRGRETTDLEGRFAVAALREGTYTVLVGPELAPITRLDALEHRGTETDLGDVVIAGLGMVRITVRDFAGAVVPGARVWEAGVAPHFDLRTDERGQCIARHLPAGQYRVFASERFHGEVNHPIQLPAGGEADLELAFDR